MSAKKKLNDYLVGGDGLPMKFIKAANVTEAKKVWKMKTKRKDDPTIRQVKKPKPKAKEAPKEALPLEAEGQGGEV